MRNRVIEEGVLPREDNRTRFGGCQRSRLFHEGMKGHMNEALKSGSSNGEILGTFLVSILGGEIVAWIEGISVMKEMGIL
jgi:alkylhydroperoxidase/carboxymuconolactone decarboxylase family protein YurZ